MEKVDVPAAPGRLISAVARIGYDPEVALCDLIDNCIDAGGTEINVTLIPEYNLDEGETDTISRYIISDNGSGMDRGMLIKAFTLGSNREYPPHSLGKFGLGLKSAGLSLGNRIVLLSKTEVMPSPLCAVLPMEEVENTGEYKIELGEVPEQYQEYWTKYAVNQDRQHGTTLILEELNDNQPSFSRFLTYLRRYCAVVYHMLLSNEDSWRTMTINGESLEPIDPLFMSEAEENGSLRDPQSWDGRTVHLLLEDHELPLTSTASATIALTNLVHPPSFEPERRAERREHYLNRV